MYDLLRGTGGEYGRKLNVVYTIEAITGTGLGEWTIQAAVNTLNDLLTADGLAPMTAGEEADFTAICTQLDGQPNTTAKLVYMNRVKCMCFAAELGKIDETKFRTSLGI